jgi:hypothetical protein
MTETSIDRQPGLTAALDWARWHTWWVFFGFAMALGAASATLTILAIMLAASVAPFVPGSLGTLLTGTAVAGLLHLLALVALSKALGAGGKGFIIREVVDYPKDGMFLLPWIFLVWTVIYGVNALSYYFFGVNGGIILAFGAVIIVVGMEFPIRTLEKSAG